MGQMSLALNKSEKDGFDARVFDEGIDLRVVISYSRNCGATDLVFVKGVESLVSFVENYRSFGNPPRLPSMPH